MRPHALVVAALCASLVAHAQDALEQAEVAPPDAPAAQDPHALDVPRSSLHDLTADVLSPAQGQLNLLYLQYSRGVIPRLQVSAHFAAYLLTLLNLTAEYQLLELPELRASIEVGGYWFALSQLAQMSIVQVYAAPRATVPLDADLELTLGLQLRALILDVPGQSQNDRDLRAELVLVRPDAGGAFYLQARLPILKQQVVHLDELLGTPNVNGSLFLDDLSAWSVLLGRDFAIGETTHVRVGAGYRNRMGTFWIESIGNVIFQLDVYWR